MSTSRAGGAVAITRARAESRWVRIAIVAVLAGCGGESSGSGDGPKGPPGGMLDVDLDQIPAVPLKGGAGGTSTGGAGAGGGTSVCAGYATSCAALPGSLCNLSQGCSQTSKCSGVSSSCYSQFDSYSCGSQEGCYWSSSSKSCSGSSWSCSSFFSQVSCIDQEGCHWDTTCQGSATPCSLMSLTYCSSQPGCSVVTK